MGVGQLLTMPLFFASNAIYPLRLTPAWLQRISLFNPLTYQVDALRAPMLAGGRSQFGLEWDLASKVAARTVLVALTARLVPRILT